MIFTKAVHEHAFSKRSAGNFQHVGWKIRIGASMTKKSSFNMSFCPIQSDSGISPATDGLILSTEGQELVYPALVPKICILNEGLSTDDELIKKFKSIPFTYNPGHNKLGHTQISVFS